MSIIENALSKAGSSDWLQQAEASVQALLDSRAEQAATTQDSANDHSISLNWQQLQTNGFIGKADSKTTLSEQFRLVKRPLMHNAASGHLNGMSRANLILICSSLPQEGKTFVSINLALSIANERDKRVLLIDADVEKPSIAQQLGIAPSVGLLDYLQDPSIRFSDMVLKTDLPNLTVIPAGKRHHYATELLSSQRMAQFAEQISNRYPDRLVIFDSPPLLVATQAHILAELVGQVVLVIAAESTPQAVVSEAVAKLSHCQVVLALLNKTDQAVDQYGYGYGEYGQ